MRRGKCSHHVGRESRDVDERARHGERRPDVDFEEMDLREGEGGWTCPPRRRYCTLGLHPMYVDYEYHLFDSIPTFARVRRVRKEWGGTVATIVELAEISVYGKSLPGFLCHGEWHNRHMAHGE